MTDLSVPVRFARPLPNQRPPGARPQVQPPQTVTATAGQAQAAQAGAQAHPTAATGMQSLQQAASAQLTVADYEAWANSPRKRLKGDRRPLGDMIRFGSTPDIFELRKSDEEAREDTKDAFKFCLFWTTWAVVVACVVAVIYWEEYRHFYKLVWGVVGTLVWWGGAAVVEWQKHNRRRWLKRQYPGQIAKFEEERRRAAELFQAASKDKDFLHNFVTDAIQRARQEETQRPPASDE